MRKTAYRPNLPNLMSLCAINYMLALKVLANKTQVGEIREFFIAEHLCYTMTVNEVTKYTSLITIEQIQTQPLASMASTSKKFTSKTFTAKTLMQLLGPKMVIRLYHDAQVAEVISSQAIRHIKPKYHYPNDLMHLPDEKLQVNIFLKEWLQVCLQHGQVQVLTVS